jgi:DnaJ-class molecular chaperone
MEWQKCPVCDGTGRLSRPSYIPGDQPTWVGSSSTFLCHACHGAGVILSPDTVSYQTTTADEKLDRIISLLEQIRDGV